MVVSPEICRFPFPFFGPFSPKFSCADEQKVHFELQNINQEKGHLFLTFSGASRLVPTAVPEQAFKSMNLPVVYIEISKKLGLVVYRRGAPIQNEYIYVGNRSSCMSEIGVADMPMFPRFIGEAGTSREYRQPSEARRRSTRFLRQQKTCRSHQRPPGW